MGNSAKKGIIQTDVTLEQLEAFDKYHKENQSYVEQFANQKIEAEKQFNEELIVFKQILANNIPNKADIDVENLPNFAHVKNMWDTISQNLRYHNNNARKIEPEVVNSTAVAMLFVKLISNDFSKHLDESKINELKELVGKKSDSDQKKRNKLLNDLNEDSIISNYWECNGNCKGNDKKMKNARHKDTKETHT